MYYFNTRNAVKYTARPNKKAAIPSKNMLDSKIRNREKFGEQMVVGREVGA